ncbi:MAG: HDOD domain-containing protein [Halioglobus sp.]
MSAGLNAEINPAMDEASVIAFSGQILGELQSGELVLPMLPEVTLKVSDMASDPDASLADLADVIVTDVTLSSQLVKVSNSPLYRGRESVDSVQVAVTRLGFKIVKNLVSSMAMQQMFQTSSPRTEKLLRSMWELNVDVSARSQLLAVRVPAVQVDEAMLAGLIYNIGVLPLLAKADQQPELFEDEATLQLLIDKLSAPIGLAVLESWDFPQQLVSVVEHHSDFERDVASEPDLVDIIQVASLQSHLNPQHDYTPEQLAALPAFRKLGIQTEVEVDELDENSAEYAEAMALFA